MGDLMRLSVIIMFERKLNKNLDVEASRSMGGLDVATHVLLIRIFRTC